MSTRNTVLIIVAVSLALILASAFLQPQMDAPLAVHWNEIGEADGYGSPFMALYFLPVMLLATSLLVLVMPRLDPMRTAKMNFRLVNWVILLLGAFMAYLHALTLAWNLGSRFNMSQLMTPGMGLMFILLGVLIRKAQPNWFVGIRTPWTLSSPVVWEKTHDLGGKLFIAAGGLALLGIFFPAASIWLVMIPVLTASVGVVAYSYVLYRQIEAKTR